MYSDRRKAHTDGVDPELFYYKINTEALALTLKFKQWYQRLSPTMVLDTTKTFSLIDNTLLTKITIINRKNLENYVDNGSITLIGPIKTNGTS